MEIMIPDFIFAISLKNKKHSEDWELVCNNLMRTLMSIKASVKQDYRVIVATNDADELAKLFTDNQITFLKADFDRPNTGRREAALDKEKKEGLLVLI